jgi:NADPH:quinone reductase-like Zn-dependent oxidoreductase
MLVTLGKIQAGQRVLIESAGSGVGTAALQIAKLVGADAAVTAGGAEKCRKLTELGADLAIDHTVDEPRKSVLNWTGGRGVDVVISHVGGSTFVKSLSCLARGGTLVTCGATAGPKIELDLRFLFTREWKIFGAYLGTRADLDAVIRLVERGRLRPIIDRRYGLEELPQAHLRMADRDLFGKLIIQP